MFFSKLFKKDKDHQYYLSQGEKHLAAERFADARIEFLEAQSRCPSDCADALQAIGAGLAEASNQLARLNLEEGEHAFNSGDLAKAFDHYNLARELAADPAIKAQASAGIKRLDDPQPIAAPVKAAAKAQAHGGSSCGSCSTGHQSAPVEEQASDVHDDDRFFLLVQPLPGDLPSRYLTLGEKFTTAYLHIHEGNDAAAFPLLQEMLLSCENDIVIYELALIMYRGGKAHECEKLLNRALSLNATNAAVYLALVHLKAETGQIAEAIVVVHRMLELAILPDQAQYLLGDLLEASGDHAAALDAFNRALEFPSMAKSAAERMMPLLANQGREAEAKYLAKRYLKGCC
jgi:tetratricopeptide (TPR) repeat protein